MEAAFDAIKGEGVIVCITEGIPILDMVKAAASNSARGFASSARTASASSRREQGGAKIGIMPGHIHAKGRIGIVSKSEPDLRGGGSNHEHWRGPIDLRRYRWGPCERHGIHRLPGRLCRPANRVVMIGEIGGNAEQEAGLAASTSEPIVGLLHSTAPVSAATQAPSFRQRHG